MRLKRFEKWRSDIIPLLETKGNQQLSKPLASIIIFEATYFILNGQPYTKGKYKVVEVFDPNDNKIHFNGFARISVSNKILLPRFLGHQNFFLQLAYPNFFSRSFISFLVMSMNLPASAMPISTERRPIFFSPAFSASNARSIAFSFVMLSL